MAIRLLFSTRFAVICAWIVAAYASQEVLVINACRPEYAQFQQWLYNQGPGKNEIWLKATGDCVDIQDYSQVDGTLAWTYPCHPDDKNPKHQNQEFSVNGDGTIVEISTQMCLERKDFGQVPGTPIDVWECRNGTVSQQWLYNQTDLTFRAADAPDLCLDAGGPIRPCDAQPLASMPACDPSAPLATRIASIVQNLRVDQKVSLLVNKAGAVPGLDLAAYQWWSEALHGVADSPGVSFSQPTPNATSFPQVVLTSASFNATLFHAIGQAISTEARAMNNAHRAGLTFWTPNINIIRDPRWGRGQETPGEDPYLNSVYAENFITGMQVGEDPTHLKVSACCKHYYAYNLESWGGVTRHDFDANVTAQDEADTYLPAFQSCIERGQVSGLMCSYNSVNGVPSCANKRTMTTLARQQWGFQGYITSDCGAVDDVQYAHKYTKSTDATCNVTLDAGMDIECGSFFTSHLQPAITSGAVSMSSVDQHLSNLFAVQFRLGMFDPYSSQPYMQYSYADNVDTAEHRQLALQAAQEGIVLLKNDAATLPFPAKYRKVAVVGPNGDVTTVLQGNYFGVPPYIVSPFAGIQSYAPNSTFTIGCEIDSTNKLGFKAAEKAASQADATVIVVGLDQTKEREGLDRTSIALPGVQADFITAVAAASHGPVVVVVIAGGSVDLTVAKNDAKVGAILWAGYPGQSGGQAIADVIFGAVNPSGRMPYTVYSSNLTGQVSMLDMNMRPGPKNPGRTYRFYTGKPVYQFGDGLSYTTFSYTQTNSTSTLLAAEDSRGPRVTPAAGVRVPLSAVRRYAARSSDEYLAPRPSSPAFIGVGQLTITVNNTGALAGRVSVLAFLVPPNPGVDGNPLRSLVGFDKTYLLPGQSQTFTFPVQAHDLTVVGRDGGREAVSGRWTLEINNGDLSIPIHVLADM